MVDNRMNRRRIPDSKDREVNRQRRYMAAVLLCRRLFFDHHRDMATIASKLNKSEDWVRNVCRGSEGGWVHWDDDKAFRRSD